MQDKKVWYEPHPVKPERKAELRKRGFQIIDAIFMPEGYENPGDDGEPDGAKKATVAELRAALEAKGVEVPDGAKKADLQALLDGAQD